MEATDERGGRGRCDPGHGRGRTRGMSTPRWTTFCAVLAGLGVTVLAGCGDPWGAGEGPETAYWRGYQAGRMTAQAEAVPPEAAGPVEPADPFAPPREPQPPLDALPPELYGLGPDPYVYGVYPYGAFSRQERGWYSDQPEFRDLRPWQLNRPWSPYRYGPQFPPVRREYHGYLRGVGESRRAYRHRQGWP